MIPAGALDNVPADVIDAITQAVIDTIADRLLTVPSLRLTSQELRIAIMLGQRLTLGEIAVELKLKHPSDVHTRIRQCCRNNRIDRHDLTLYGTFMAWRSKGFVV